MKCICMIAISTLAFVNSVYAADYLNVYDLKIGAAYVVSRQTPLMSEVDPADPIAALKKMKQIPIGGTFEITGIQVRDGKPWYKVRAISPDQKEIGDGFINSVALLGQTLRAAQKQSPRTDLAKTTHSRAGQSYVITSSRNFNYRNPKTRQLIRRKEYRVHLRKEHSQMELKRVAEEVIAQAPPVDAIVVFLYLPDSEPTGAYTAGKGTWAPDGKWEDAGKPAPKKLVMKYGGLLPAIPKEDQVNLPVSKKKAIFMTLVRYEDQGMGSERACTATAKKYGITEEEVKKIGIEGLVKNWPMP